MAIAIPGASSPRPALRTREETRVSGPQQPTDAAEAATAGRTTGRSRDDLALSIRRDGGLSLLQTELQRKLEGMFARAEERHPGGVAADPAAAFGASADTSPAATAERIVGFALGFERAYRAQNPDLDEDQARVGFEAEIRRGIEDGFAQAREVLSGLRMLDGEVQANADLTYDLVQQMLAEAFAAD